MAELDELRALAAAYRDAASHEWADGTRRHWTFKGARELHTFMLALCGRIDALEAELLPEGPAALAQARREVEVLEARIVALQTGDCPL